MKLWKTHKKEYGKHNKGNSGFTLVELIVTLAVLVIMCSIAVVSLTGWQERSWYRRNNEAAKSVFTAAQIQLTQYGERGQLTELIDLITEGGKADPQDYLLRGKTISNETGTIVVGDGSSGSIWKDFADGSGKNVGNIYFLMAEKGDYKRYEEIKQVSLEALKGSGYQSKDRKIRALYDLIDPYIADKSLLDGAICIEFDPDPKVALVYSVLFSGEKNSFTYDAISGSASDKNASIQSRTEQDRKKNQIGYYGADTMAKGTDTYISKPVITQLSLNNKDTLNLSWKVLNGENHSVDDTALTTLLYTITLCDATDPVAAPVLQIVLGKEDRKLDTGLWQCAVYSAAADGSGKYIYTREPDVDFSVNHSMSEGTLTLILDGLDLQADETLAEMETTASIKRLKGITADKRISATIVGRRPGVYDTTAEKRSNPENPFFGNRTVADDKTVIYTVANMRHFNNIRFSEWDRVNQSSAPLVEYRLSTDLNWPQTLLAGGVYENGHRITPTEEQIGQYYFKPFLRLGANSAVLSSDERKARTIAGLNLNIDHMQSVAGLTDSIPQGVIGLFVVNRGKLDNLSLSSLTVNGVPETSRAGNIETMAAGGFCGYNSGQLSNLTVLSDTTAANGASTISGVANVGGIMGKNLPLEVAETYRNLENHAAVSGQLYVGGIAGSLQSADGDVLLENSNNYGRLQGKILSQVEGNTLDGAYFIGGITGRTAKGAGNITIRNAKSSPYYTQEELDNILTAAKDPNSAATVLVGNYVGGIVGYNVGGTIEACNTIRQNANTQGYVVGQDYVGGIVGYNSGDTGLGVGADNRNQAYVIGRSYVGGIVGMNALGNVDSNYQLQLTPKTLAGNKTADVIGWVNEGMVMSTGNYVGGITGYNGNTGVIQNSYSNVDYQDDMRTLKGISSEAKYAGGVAGYNGGAIVNRDSDGSISDEPIAVVSVVEGKDYVGGVIGFNDKEGVIEAYSLRGGYIEGERFVGGYMGVNLNPATFSHTISSDPNQVTGNYFVGGVIGANLMVTRPDTNVQAEFTTDNFLGTIEVENGAFAGGFIGYNYTLADTGSLDANTIKEALDTLRFAPLPEGQTDVTTQVLAMENAIEGLLAPYKNQETKFIVRPNQEGSISQEKMGGITGRVYVGGVIGYNQESSIVEIYNVENVTPVVATGYVTKTESVNNLERNYSYSGGIVGKVSTHVLLDNCTNRDVGSVRSEGTYTGGLAEINYGTIQNCTTGNLGDSARDYVGGLVGINGGNIFDCIVEGQIVGGSYVGGLASENYGTIRYDASKVKNSSADSVVEGNGLFVGGLTGYAYSQSKIEVKMEEPVKITVQGEAAVVGGLVGANEGSIKGYGGSGDSRITNDGSAVSIFGDRYVGGFVGVQLRTNTGTASAQLEQFANYAHVRANSGFAGGIVSVAGVKSDDKITIERSENYGLVEVLSDEDDQLEEGTSDNRYNQLAEDLKKVSDLYPVAAGGILAVNFGQVSECGNYESINASNGILGGIAAVNYNKISNSTVGESVDFTSEERTIELTGREYTGGVAAVNEEGGTIKNCAAKNLLLRNQSESQGGSMGGIAAWNSVRAQIQNCFVGIDATVEQLKQNNTSNYSTWRGEAATYVTNTNQANLSSFQRGGADTIGNTVVLVSNGTNVNMGGVAGVNEGRIEGESSGGYHTVVAAELKFFSSSLSYYGNMGGIVGYNDGVVRNYEYNGFVMGSANDPSSTPGYNPSYDLEPSRSRVYGYGGIVGRNGNDRSQVNTATVNSCYLGMAKIQATGDSSNRTNVGGVAGFNGMGAKITNITFSQLTDMTDQPGGLFQYTVSGKKYSGSVWVKGENCGHIGGVAGYNHGTISDINWSTAYARNRQEKWGSDGRYYGYFKDGAPTYSADPSQYNWSEVDGTGALVTTNAGHIGGIVGYNRRTGVIQQAVTGHNWLVYAESQEQDNGIAGIMGFSISEQDLLSCDNHATVIKTVRSSNAVGGMAGRTENGTTSSWRFYDCHNYGDITGYARSGGMIGNWKYRGGTLENCQNYGTITATLDAAGGMVALIYDPAVENDYNFVGCENHGTVKTTDGAAYAAGILGYVRENSAGSIMNMNGCVNTGTINARANSGGLMGTSRSTNTYLNMTNCRNYGYSETEGDTSFAGLSFYSSSAGSRVKIADSFGVTDITPTAAKPITPVEGASKGGYYFGLQEEESGSIFIDRVEATSPRTIGNVGNIFRLITDMNNASSGNFYFSPGSTTNTGATLAFYFRQPVYHAELYLEWIGVPQKQYAYEIEVLEEGSTDWISAGEGTNDSVHNFDENGITAVRFINPHVTAWTTTDKNASINRFQMKGALTPNGAVINYTKLKSGPVSGTNYTLVENENDGQKEAICNVMTSAASTAKGTPLVFANSDSSVAYSTDRSRQIDFGNYRLSDIRNNGRYTDSTLSWKLYKGTDARESLDSHLVFQGGSGAELKTPAGLAAKAQDNDYQVSWTGDTNAQYYEVKCEYSNGETKTYTSYATSLLMPPTAPSGERAEHITITVTAYGQGESKTSEPYDLEVGDPLPYPQIRWEMVNLGFYRVVLVNKEEYEAFAAKEGISTQDIQINVYNPRATLNGKTIDSLNFRVSEGGKKSGEEFLLYGSNSATNTVFQSRALYVGTAAGHEHIQGSALVYRESMYPPLSTLNKQGTDGRMASISLEKRTAADKSVGFSGTTINDLQYRLTMDKIGDTVADFRSEIMADDPVLGVPVALSVSRQTKISPTNNSVIAVQLGGFPTDFLDKEADSYKYKNVMVRAYPTKMANDIIYQGWEMEEGTTFTADELKNLMVGDTGRMGESDESLLINNGKLKPGYVIERAGNDTYTLYYNSFLKVILGGDANVNGGQPVGFADEADWIYNGSKSYMKCQMFYHRLDLEKALESVQPKPVVYANAVYEAAASGEGGWKNGAYDNDENIVLTWDKKQEGAYPAYTNPEGQNPFNTKASYILNLYGVTKDINGTERTTVLLNNLAVTTDTTDSNYNSYTFPAETVEKWNYTELRGTITRVGTVDSSGSTTAFPSVTEISLPMRSRLPRIEDVQISLKKENGVVLKDALDYTISFKNLDDLNAAPEEKAALEHYEITVTSKDNPGKELTVVTTSNTGEVSLREKFDRREQISIMVKAVAKDGSLTFRDGLDSAAVEMQVPSWLLPPQMGTPQGGTSDNMTRQGADTLSVEDFQKGSLQLHMEREAYSATANVSYQIAMELYPTQEDAKNRTNRIEAADTYLPARNSNPVVSMTSDTYNGYTYTLEGLPIQYAGTYVRIVLRARGNGSISSVWTDEQSEENMSPGEELVEPCRIYKLPDVQVDAVEMEMATSQSYNYPLMVGGRPYEEEGAVIYATAEQYTVSFNSTAFASGYEITSIQTGQQADKKASPSDAQAQGYLVQDVDELLLTKKNEQQYQLDITSTQRDVKGEAVKKSLTLTVDEEAKELPVTEPVLVASRDGQNQEYAYIEVKYYIQLLSQENGEVQVLLTLPDCEAIYDTNNNPIKENAIVTEQLLVQSLVDAKETSTSYLDSKWAFLLWNGTDFIENEPLDLTDAAHTVQEPSAGVTTLGVNDAIANDNVTITIHDVAYMLKDIKGSTRYLITATDSHGNFIGRYAVPYVSAAVWGESDQQVWFPMNDFAPYEGQQVKISFTSIFPGNDVGGLSPASTVEYTVALPELPSWAQIDAYSIVADNQQYAIVWEYSEGDLSTIGYQMEIDQNQIYTLQVDLEKGWFGTTPGLEDYLTENGKVLYVVAYNANGDISTASNATVSNATASSATSRSTKNKIELECRLKAEYLEDGSTIQFTLFLPDQALTDLDNARQATFAENYVDGLRKTERVRITPITANKYYRKPENDWIYPEDITLLDE